MVGLAGGTVRADGTRTAARCLRATHERPQLEQRAVERDVGPCTPGETVQIQAELESAMILARVDAGTDTHGVLIEKHRSPAKAEAEHRLGRVITDCGQRSQFQLALWNLAREMVDEVPGDSDERLCSPSDAPASGLQERRPSRAQSGLLGTARGREVSCTALERGLLAHG